MLISCKCLNFIATSNSHQNYNAIVPVSGDVIPISSSEFGTSADCSISSINASAGSVAMLLMNLLKKYPRTFPFYSQCMDFFRQSIGPISDLFVNTIIQPDLVYGFTLEIQQPINKNQPQSETWLISICINCNTVLCAKRLSTYLQTAEVRNYGKSIIDQHQQYILSCSLLTNNEELLQRRSDKSFSETFGILILDHPQLENGHNILQETATSNNVSNTFTFRTPTVFSLDPKQKHIKYLQHNFQTHLQKEIFDTDERIQRYTEQQFALLKILREKSEQEFKLLAKRIDVVSQHYKLSGEIPLAVEANGGTLGIGIQHRRNSIGDRADLIIAQPNTPTTLSLLPSNSLVTQAHISAVLLSSSASAIDGSINIKQYQFKTCEQEQSQSKHVTSNHLAGFNKSKVSFDTPPTMPDTTPMSVGHSPIYSQHPRESNVSFGVHLTIPFQQQFPTPTIELSDDYLFEMEGVNSNNTTSTTVGGSHHNQLNFSVSANFHNHQRKMGDLDASDSAEEAEDALCLQTSNPIPMQEIYHRQVAKSHMLHFAKSLPLKIENLPLTEHTHADNSYEDDLDNTVDIAASIKALAKSVRGEAVFGDLPRPRLRSQI